MFTGPLGVEEQVIGCLNFPSWEVSSWSSEKFALMKVEEGSGGRVLMVFEVGFAFSKG